MKRFVSLALILGLLSFTPANGSLNCPPCPWDYLGFNPWNRWNVFSLGDIGSAAKPLGGDFQGRMAAVGSAWFKAFSIHDVNQGAGPFSVSVGGDFSLLGGTVSNGGIEAGHDITLQNADVAQGDVSAGHNLFLGGGSGKAATIGGQGLAGNTVILASPPDGSTAASLTFPNPGFTLSVNLNAVAQFFKDTSTDYAAGNPAGHTATITFANGATDGIIAVQSGLNYLTLTSAQFVKLARITLDGPSDGVLVINVAGNPPALDGFDVYVGPSFNSLPTYGRVLVNFPTATALTLNAASGSWTLLAPLAAVTYSSGVITGNVVVGSLSRVWEGGTQVNVLPWTPPCPPCTEVTTAVACQHETASPSCPFGSTISIIDANYGRTDSTLCPGPNQYNTNCHAASSLSQVQAVCQGMQSCVVYAESSVFGDPCVGTFKYLLIHYSCIASASRKALPQNYAQHQMPQRTQTRRANAQSSTSQQSEFQQAQQQQSSGVPQWAVIAGGAVAGVALTVFVLAVRARRAGSGSGSSMQATPSGFKVMSPHSVSSPLSHRSGRGTQFAASP